MTEISVNETQMLGGHPGSGGGSHSREEIPGRCAFCCNGRSKPRSGERLAVRRQHLELGADATAGLRHCEAGR